MAKHPTITDKQINNDLSRLTKGERRIYDAVMKSFPATHHLSAYDAAIQGGVKFQFIPT